ncbi:HigA family addiction module antitoxin, partial [Escherichia coli]
MEPLALKINEFAELLHVHRNCLSALININRELTTERAFRLAKVFDTTVEFWRNLPAAVDRWVGGKHRRTEGDLGRV